MPPAPPPDDRPLKGRPPKLTEAMVEAILALLRAGCYRCVACKQVGINPGTLRKWIRLGEAWPDGLYARLRAGVPLAETEAETEAIKRILQAGEVDADHLKWFLERRYPQRWGRFRGETSELKRRINALEKLLSADLGGEEVGGERGQE